MIDAIVQAQAEIKALRQNIHAHPELGFEEQRTADLIIQKLREWGIDFESGIGGTGIVAWIKGKPSDHEKAIGLRADMDALPLQELNQFSHASIYPGKMHACGHDGHTAMLLGAAQYLAQTREFKGTVYLIFQPAEETGSGALRMMADGLFDRFPMQAVFGMHNWPGIAAGHFGLNAGPMMASSNEFEITIQGKGAHAAMPHFGQDPIMTAVQLAQSLQTLITRNKKPVDTAVLSITQIHAGSAYNVIPDVAVLRGTVRTFSAAVTDFLEQRMREIATLTAQALGTSASISFKRSCAPLINHENETRVCTAVLNSLVGTDNVIANLEPTMGAEDFAYLLQAKPGCYIFIGNGETAGATAEHRAQGHGLGPCALHNPSYDFNDNILALGSSYWVKLVEAILTE